MDITADEIWVEADQQQWASWDPLPAQSCHLL
jgi:hypothetical protein